MTRENVVFSTTPVDLIGRLSNPPEQMKYLVDKGAENARHGPKRRSPGSGAVAGVVGSVASEETGRLSNPALRPVQRRLRSSEIDLIAIEYRAGRSLRAIAEVLGVHHHTVAAHLQQLGIPRRANERKMSANDVVDASRRYVRGESLATIAGSFSVDATTVRRELRRMGIAVRPRRGWA